MKIPLSLKAISLLVPTARTYTPLEGAVRPRPEVTIETPHPLQEYYLKGYTQLSFSDPSTSRRLLEVLGQLRQAEPKSGFTWEQKYFGTVDLRPNVYAYDSIFVDVLFANNIPQLLRQVTGYDLHLGHIQLRRVDPNSSYMDWHRDTHFYRGKLAGNLPPVHKIIFYPAFGEKLAPTLLVCPGSHRRMFSHKIRDIMQVRSYGEEVIKTGDNQCLLFDTSLLHGVIPQTDRRGELRLVYSFYHEFQLKQYKQFQPLAEAYQARLQQ